MLLEAWQHSMHVGMEAWAELEHLYGRKIDVKICMQEHLQGLCAWETSNLMT